MISCTKSIAVIDFVYEINRSYWFRHKINSEHWFRHEINAKLWFCYEIKINFWFRNKINQIHWFRNEINKRHWFRDENTIEHLAPHINQPVSLHEGMKSCENHECCHCSPFEFMIRGHQVVLQIASFVGHQWCRQDLKIGLEGGEGEAKFFDQFALFCHIVHIACFAHYVIKRSTKLSSCASERALGKLHILQSQTEDILVPQCKTLAPVRANQFWYFKTCARASEWQASARLKMHTMIPNEAILVVTSLCMQTRMQKNKKHILWSHDEVFFLIIFCA